MFKIRFELQNFYSKISFHFILKTSFLNCPESLTLFKMALYFYFKFHDKVFVT